MLGDGKGEARQKSAQLHNRGSELKVNGRGVDPLSPPSQNCRSSLTLGGCVGDGSNWSKVKLLVTVYWGSRYFENTATFKNMQTLEGQDSTNHNRELKHSFREAQTATRSQMFPFLARFCPPQQTGKALVGCLWLDVTNMMVSKCSKKKTIRLPVAVLSYLITFFSLPSISPVDFLENKDNELNKGKRSQTYAVIG